MTKVNNLDKARDFFLSNSSGNIICTDNDGNEKECNCYPEAVSFYKKEN